MCVSVARMDRVTIREKEAAEKREEQLQTERKRQEELRKRESQRVSRTETTWLKSNCNISFESFRGGKEGESKNISTP